MSLVSKATAPFIARASIKSHMWFGRGDDEDSLVYYVLVDDKKQDHAVQHLNFS